jgi:hypothetical protein
MTSRFPPSCLLTLSIALFVLACDQKPVDISPSVAEIPWTQIEAFPYESRVTDVWGSGPDDVYAGYYGSERALRHFDGQAWEWVTLEAKNYVREIWGSGANDVYVLASDVGSFDNHRLIHFDGVDWSDTGLSGRRVVGTSAQDVYVLDDRSIHRFNGAAWDTIRTSTQYRSFSTAWALPGNHLVAVRSIYPEPDTLIRWDGSSWTSEPAPGDVYDLWGTAPNDLFATGRDVLTGSGAIWRWDGLQWNPMQLPGQFDYVGSIAGVTASEAYATTCCGTLLKYDGVAWQSEILPTTENLYSPWASSSSDIYVVAGSELLHGDGVTWAGVFNLQPKRAELVWAESPQRLVVLGENGEAYRYDHGVWTEESIGDFRGDFRALVGDDWNNLYVSASYDGILHYDGTGWSLLSDTPARDLALAPNGDLFAVGVETLRLFDGSTWTESNETDRFLTTVWAAASDYAIVLGGLPGTIWQYDGSTLRLLYESSEGFEAVWGISESEVYIVGSAGLLRYDGTRLARFGPTEGFERIAGTSSQHIIATGYPGEFFKIGPFWTASARSSDGTYLDLVPAKDGSIVRLIGDPQTQILSLSYHRQ